MEQPVEKDKNTRTFFPLRLSKLWKLRILLYTLVFLCTVIFFYQEFIVYPLEVIKKWNVSDRHFMWKTYNEGVAVAYLYYYLILILFFFVEFVLHKLYYEPEGELELIRTSKRICMGIGVTALLVSLFLPVWFSKI